MNNQVNPMKTSTEMQIDTESHESSTQSNPAARRPGAILKVSTVMLSLAALCLSYQAANEAVALYGMLAQAQDALAHEQLVRSQVADSAAIAETIPPVAGL